MQFFANKLNGNFLRNVLPGEDIDVDWVRAAIAYGSDATTLVQNCLANKRRLDIWMRYDHTVPVTPLLLRKLLKSTDQNVFCYLVPDVLHSKVIWWKNYGVYIGSANLTDRAWVTNIEFGVFIPETDLEIDGGISEIEIFFEELIGCEATFPLTEEIIQEQERIAKLRSDKLKQIDEETEKHRRIKRWGGPVHVTAPQKAFEAHKSRFVKEWANGLTILRNLAAKAPEYKPKWLNGDVPPAWQADQFLHAYYYNEVVDGVRHPFEEHHQRNKKDPARATEVALKWWSQLDAPPSSEDHNCHLRAPIIRKLLAPDRIKLLSLEEFASVCQANHSTVDHVRRMRLETLGLNESPDATEQDRVAAFAKWLWGKQNGRNERVDDLLAYVFDGGPPEDIPSRLYEAANQLGRKFSHFGTNQIAELTGWARPEICPPRNGRTSKGLRALGYDVHVY